jgi:lipoyl-dependent peroxiredoxin
MKQQAMAEWSGDLKTGKGSLTTVGGVLDKTRDSFTTRFGDPISVTNSLFDKNT